MSFDIKFTGQGFENAYKLTLRGLLSDSTCVLKAEPGIPDIKRREPGILFISLQVDSIFKLAIKTSLSRFELIQYHL